MRCLTSLFTVLFVTVTQNLWAQPCSRVSTLPTFCISTGGEITSKDTYVNGTLEVLADDGTPGMYNGEIEIRGRGNSTWQMEKKPYRMRLKTSTNLLGLPANARNWALLANHADKTMIRNALAFEISKYLNMPYTVTYHYVDIVLNGEYKGTYLLTDHVEVREGRVDVENTEDDDPGAFLIEIDGFAESEDFYYETANHNKFTFKYPDVEANDSPHLAYVTQLLDQFESQLYSGLPGDHPDSYLKYADLNSMVNWYLACELIGNSDAFWTVYLHKRKTDEKFYFGPLWDFDIAFNNDIRIKKAPYRLMADVGHFYGYQDWMYWFRNDDFFMKELKSRWLSLREAGLKEFVLNKVNELANTLINSGSVHLNYVTWPVLEEQIHNEVFLHESYDEHINFLYQYVEKRFDWLDKELLGLPTNFYYRVDNFVSEKTLSALESGNDVVQRTFQDHPDFKWAIEPLENGFYRLKLVGRNLYLSAVDNSSQTTLEASAPGDWRQQWRITEVDDNVYMVINRKRNFGIQIRDVNANENNPVDIETFANNGLYRSWLENREHARWTFTPEEITLPINLATFEGRSIEGMVALNWTISDFSNGSHVEVQRLNSSNVFETLAQMQLRSGAIKPYTWIDPQPLEGINYYRLKLVDLDGTYTLSYMVAVEANTKRQDLLVYPNPAIEYVNFNLDIPAQGMVEYQITDALGRPIIERKTAVEKGVNRLSVKVQGLPEGMYVLRTNYHGDVRTVRFLKSKY